MLKEVKSRPVYFWQGIISPHMAYLAASLAETGRSVSYVYQQDMSSERALLGWKAPDVGKCSLVPAGRKKDVADIVACAPLDSIHICQGLRGNGLIGYAQNQIKKRDLEQWVVMETVRTGASIKGLVRTFVYRRLIKKSMNYTKGILANGYRTRSWLIKNGAASEKVYPFGYFLNDDFSKYAKSIQSNRKFRFIYVGTIDGNKRVDLIVKSLSTLKNNYSFKLQVVGGGPMLEEIKRISDELLPGRVIWSGRLSIDNVAENLAASDCLILPSDHDGWGAVASEALMCGTRVVCSDSCGVAGAVVASKSGGIFPKGSDFDLARQLEMQLARGRVSQHERCKISAWATCLGASRGAEYLSHILGNVRGDDALPPWEHTVRDDCYVNKTTRD